MNRKCLGIIVLLLLVIGGGIYKFIFQGSVSVATDGRTVIHLDAGERDLVLTEMRVFLTSIQQIIQGISEGDMKLAAEHARNSGRAAQADVPGTLIGKLPLPFKQLGFDTHSKFDLLAMDIEDMGDADLALSGLSTLMKNCNGCHAAWRIEVSGE